MIERRPLRDIVSRRLWQTRHHHKNNDSVTLTLSCGHVKNTKLSTAPQRRARCDACEKV